MKKIKILVTELKNLGVKNIMNIEEIEKIINVYLEKKVMILQNDNFNIEYDVERKNLK